MAVVLQDHPLAGVVYAAARPVPPAQNNHGEVYAAIRTTPDLAGPDIQVFMIDVPFHPAWVPYNHPVGTCRIGTDPTAVVDPRLRVRGIDRLRVADASVMPAIPGANIHAAVLAIAERATTLIGQ